MVPLRGSGLASSESEVTFWLFNLAILDCAGGEVIDDKDLMALLQEVLREVRTNESRAACNQNFS